jgi:hypothetical protein
VTSSVALALLLAVLAASLAWLLAGGRRRRARRGRLEDRDAVDEDVLGEAEDELRDLNAFTSPEEVEEELPDWGPGAPNR